MVRTLAFAGKCGKLNGLTASAYACVSSAHTCIVMLIKCEHAMDDGQWVGRPTDRPTDRHRDQLPGPIVVVVVVVNAKVHKHPPLSLNAYLLFTTTPIMDGPRKNRLRQCSDRNSEA